MARTTDKLLGRLKRKKHIRKNVFGTAERPRLSVFRSGKHIYAQIIDDDRGHTLVAASSLAAEIKGNTEIDGGNKDGAKAVGKLLGERAVAASITIVVFDRNGFKYHGRIAALADAAREAGLQF
jgi:large subunit ribosomal protein L18